MRVMPILNMSKSANKSNNQSKPTFQACMYDSAKLVELFSAIGEAKALKVGDILVKSKQEIRDIKAFEKEPNVGIFDVYDDEASNVIKFLSQSILSAMEEIGKDIGKINKNDEPEAIAKEIIRSLKAANADAINKRLFPSPYKKISKEMTDEINS